MKCKYQPKPGYLHSVLFCSVLFCSVLFCSVAHAGTLSPQLAALASGKTTAHQIDVRQRATPPGPFDARVDSQQRVQVYIRPATPDTPLASTAELTMLGTVKIVPSPVLRVVQAWVPISKLNLLASLPGVGRVTIPAYAIVPHPPVRPSTPHQSNTTMSMRTGVRASTRASTESVVTGLQIDQEAITAMQADQLQTVNATGRGIKVGVISDDNSGLAESQAAGYLPATVWADPTYPGTTATPGDPAEGTAMLEEVHAMAPEAELGFCAPNTSVDLYQTCYQDFINWGAKVITDDLGFPTDMFAADATATGSLAAAVAQLTSANPNVTFTSAGGNDAQDYFQSTYFAYPGSAQTINGTAYASLMDFGAAIGAASFSELTVTLSDSTTFTPILEWNDPLNTNPDQFTLFLVDGAGNVLASGTAGTDDDGRPRSAFSYTTGTSSETDYLVIACQTCANPVTLKLNGLGNGGVQFDTVTDGSVGFGQVIAPGVLTTVAASVTLPNPLAIATENFSSTGPFLYGDYAGTGTLAKPDLTGIDNVTVSGAGGFAGGPGPSGTLFPGTSATSPNVGALIADIMSAYPGQPASFYYTTLKNTANQTAFFLTPYSFNSAGYGLAQGYDALKSFFTFPFTSITAPVSVANGANGSYTVLVNVPITFTAAVVAGTNTAAASNCAWESWAGTDTQDAVTASGASTAWTFPSAGTYTVLADCPDSQSILDPTPPTVTVTAMVPVPTVTASNITTTGFGLTLTGQQPLTVTAHSSNSAVLADSSIQVSSGCGTSSLTCTVTLSPGTYANGSTTISLTATDPYGQTGTASVPETYTAPKPTVALSNITTTGFSVTLTGAQPLTVAANSSNTAVLPASGVVISSGCGVTTLACTVTLTPATQANGNATITITATDPYGQSGSAQASASYSYTPPASGGSGGSGGGGGAEGILGMFMLLCLIIMRRRI